MFHRFNWTKVSHRRNWISQEYEPLQPYYLLQLANASQAKAFVDVGANIGMYSVLMSQTVDRIVAYEANTALAKEIEDNFALNNINGEVRCVAVSNEAGRVTFGIVSRYAGNSAVVDTEDTDQKYSKKDSVAAVRLDDELESMDGPIVLKIDVEGHELPVLEGAARTLKEKPCIIQIENFDSMVNRFLLDLNYRALTSIGPDTYFTNIAELEPLETYEQAIASLIKANHEYKTMVFRRGDLSFVVSGRIYEFLRKTAQRFLRGRL